MLPFSISPLVKEKSVSLAAGYEISISLKPHLTRCSKKIVFCSMVMGVARAWFPSRRSVESHIGTRLCTFDGHRRSSSFRGVYGLYLSAGCDLCSFRHRSVDEDVSALQNTYSILIVPDGCEKNASVDCRKKVVKRRGRELLGT